MDSRKKKNRYEEPPRHLVSYLGKQLPTKHGKLRLQLMLSTKLPKDIRRHLDGWISLVNQLNAKTCPISQILWVVTHLHSWTSESTASGSLNLRSVALCLAMTAAAKNRTTRHPELPGQKNDTFCHRRHM